MDDILREIKTSTINQKLGEFNKLHRKLEFTVEREEGDCIPFLDMKIIHNDKKFTSAWYSKATDTGLTMNFHSLAPIKYKVFHLHKIIKTGQFSKITIYFSLIVVKYNFDYSKDVI